MTAPDLPFGFLLGDAHRLFRRRFERAAEAAGLGLTAGEARTLAFVAAYEGLRQAGLAEVMNVDPMTLVGHLDALEAKGLVAREPDPTDRRAKRVRPTPAAAGTVAAIGEVGRGIRAVATRGLAEADVAALRGTLLRIVANLSEAAAAEREPAGDERMRR